MTCDECRERLQELVDDELIARERNAVEAHMATCATCTQEYKDVAHFTTSVAKAVRPLRPSAELSSKVLTVYHESREQLTAAPAPRKPVPVWIWIAAVGVLVLSGATILFWPSGTQDLGRIRQPAAGTRVLAYSNTGWQPTGRIALRAGERIEALQAGTEVTIEFGASGEAVLSAPCALQADRAGETLTLQLLQQAPGRIVLRTKSASAAASKRLRVAWGSAWVEVSAGETNDVTVEPLNGGGGGWTGQLRASVKAGAARLGNTGEPQTVGEGFSRVVPQSGECEAAKKVE